MVKLRLHPTLTSGVLFALLSCPASGEQARFVDTFDGDLSAWQLVGAQAISIVDSGDPEHGDVLVLEPDGTVLALVDGSETWARFGSSSTFCFPTTGTTTWA